MDATARIEEPPSPSFAVEWGKFWVAVPDKAVFGLLLAAWILLFQFLGCANVVSGLNNTSMFSWLWDKWDNPANDAGHAKLIPFVFLAMIWSRRERLTQSVRAGFWPALVLIVFALCLHVVGYVVQQPRFSVVAFFSGAWGLVGLVWGWETMKVTFFPFFIFGFCVPVGGTFAQGITLPLRLFAAKVTQFITHALLGIDVKRVGTDLIDNRGHWHYEVAAECSGIRSFVALLAISTIFCVLTMRRLWKRALMISMTVPLALVCNVLRLTTIILVAAAYKSQAAGKMVDNYFGYVTYAVAIGTLLLIGRWLREKPPVTSP